MKKEQTEREIIKGIILDELEEARGLEGYENISISDEELDSRVVNAYEKYETDIRGIGLEEYARHEAESIIDDYGNGWL